MRRKRKSALESHRARLAREGKVRVEVTIRREDVPLIREVATALNDPARAAQTRVRLRDSCNYHKGMTFKDLLATGPSFEGMDLERSRDSDRDIDLDA